MRIQQIEDAVIVDLQKRPLDQILDIGTVLRSFMAQQKMVRHLDCMKPRKHHSKIAYDALLAFHFAAQVLKHTGHQPSELRLRAS